MSLFITTFCVFLFIIAIMAIGVIFSNKPIKGSCGGLSTLGLKDSCPICGGGDDEPEMATRSSDRKLDVFYDAMAESSKQHE
ncbi:hypothetical protein CI610_00963 [invertebrate metagenome]|uniref:(Na+)-NQR maturation NqrM n=1 Tax=invertebrate metagenome TaxID=1711999 RepID=A0A2H9TA41_9ZZZZ